MYTEKTRFAIKKYKARYNIKQNNLTKLLKTTYEKKS